MSDKELLIELARLRREAEQVPMKVEYLKEKDYVPEQVKIAFDEKGHLEDMR